MLLQKRLYLLVVDKKYLMIDQGSQTSTSGSAGDDNQSFLHEAQQAGKAQGKVDLSHLDEALESICHIINEEAVALYKSTPEEEWPTLSVACYSPKAECIVPGKIVHSRRGNPSVVCNKTGSEHIVRAREEVLIRHFHLDEETKARKKREPKKLDKKKLPDN